MAQHDYGPAIAKLADRVTELEGKCETEEDREVNRLLRRIVRSIQMTLWLTNGAVKWLAAPIGIFWGIYAFGANFADWLLSIIGDAR